MPVGWWLPMVSRNDLHDIAVQPFWGEACRRAGVGPKPIPIDSLNKSKLIQALKYMAKPEVPYHSLSHIRSAVLAHHIQMQC